MATQYNEQALESLIEKSLTGYCLEELKAENTSIDRVQELQKQYLKGTGYYIGAPANFDKKYALDTARFWDFLEETQPKEVEKRSEEHTSELQSRENLVCRLLLE